MAHHLVLAAPDQAQTVRSQMQSNALASPCDEHAGHEPGGVGRLPGPKLTSTEGAPRSGEPHVTQK